MVPCKADDLDPVTPLVAPLVFAVGRKVDVSGYLGLEPESRLVLRVQDSLGEPRPLDLLLGVPGSPRHLKRHVVSHQGVLHPYEDKKWVRSFPAARARSPHPPLLHPSGMLRAFTYHLRLSNPGNITPVACSAVPGDQKKETMGRRTSLLPSESPA